jgi:gliding motility-associated-like protein
MRIFSILSITLILVLPLWSQEKNAEVNCPISVSATVLVNENCSGDANGAAYVSLSGGTTGPYTYKWSTGRGEVNYNTIGGISGLKAGTYSVTVTEAAACSASTVFIITEPPALSIQSKTIINPSACGAANGSINITMNGGTPPYNYLWSNGSVNPSITGLTAGMYMLLVTDNKGCIFFEMFAVSETNFPNLNLVGTNVNCKGANTGSVAVSDSTSATNRTYMWTTGVFNKPSIHNLYAGTYAVTVTDVSGCKFVKTITITQPPAIDINYQYAQPPACGVPTTVIATASGGVLPYSYSWSNGSGGPVLSAVAGVYGVTVTDAKSCTKKDMIPLSNDNGPIINLTGKNIVCHGDNTGSAEVSVNGTVANLSYSWSTGATGVTSINGLTAGKYGVVVKNLSGCVSAKTIMIDESAPIYIFAIPVFVSCTNPTGSIYLLPIGGTSPYTYSWSNASTGSSITGVPPGVYQIKVTDANGCFNSVTSTIYDTKVGKASISAQTNISCNGSKNGSLTVTCTGVSSSYTYSWSNGSITTTSATSNSIVSLGPGTYSVSVSASGGCSYTIVATITEPPVLSTSISVVNATTQNACDGSIVANVAGGTPGYTYLWSDNSTSQSKPNVCAGNYFGKITVTDAHGCLKIDSVKAIVDIGRNCDLHIYNMITPNNDGANDYWHIDCITNHPGNHAAIFNRWGNKVWEVSDYNNLDHAWKGANQSGTALPEGTYFYILKTDLKEYSGKIELVK